MATPNISAYTFSTSQVGQNVKLREVTMNCRNRNGPNPLLANRLGQHPVMKLRTVASSQAFISATGFPRWTGETRHQQLSISKSPLLRTSIRPLRRVRSTRVPSTPVCTQDDGNPEQSSSSSPSTSSVPAPKQPIPVKEASSKAEDLKNDVIATMGWVGLAAAVATAIVKWKGSEAGLQFITAYIVEYSLSVDNLFVFLLIFTYFKVPRDAQTRVLGYGIAGAVFFRGIMIVAGTALTQRFKGVTLAFAAILLLSAAKIVFSGDADEDEDVGQSAVVKFASKLLPFADEYDGERFFTNKTPADSTQKWLATPLMLVLLSIEFSDIVFAFDSVPAVLGISNDTLIIYVSNILAIAGLRNLYFILADSIDGLRFLPQSLAVVLGFVGAKMAAGVFGYEIEILQSLAIVVTALGGGVGLSLLFPEPEQQ